MFCRLEGGGGAKSFGPTIFPFCIPPLPVIIDQSLTAPVSKIRLKHCCYCAMLLMRTTKTAVCLQTKAIFSSSLWVLIGVLAKFHE